MHVIETFVESKKSQPAICEDMIVVGDHFVAVFDGATDKTDRLFDGVPGGRFAVERLAEAMAGLDRDVAAIDCIGRLTLELARAIASYGPGEADETPSAAAVIYSSARSEIWRLGDCSWAAAGQPHIGRKPIDKIVAEARAALLRALIAGGSSVDSLLGSDPGRAMVLPLLEEQHRFRNLDDPGCDLCYGSFDGTRVPDRFIEVTPIAPGTEVILATDGYPVLLPTLEATEAALAEDIAADPLRIGAHKSTKAVAPQQTSFDDRAYLRLEV